MGMFFARAVASPTADGIEVDQVDRQHGAQAAALLPMTLPFIIVLLSQATTQRSWMPVIALVAVLTVASMHLVQHWRQRHRPWLCLADGKLTWFGVRVADERCFPLSDVVTVRLTSNGNWIVPRHALCVVTADEVHEVVIPPVAQPVLPTMRAVLSKRLGDRFIDHSA